MIGGVDRPALFRGLGKALRIALPVAIVLVLVGVLGRHAEDFDWRALSLRPAILSGVLALEFLNVFAAFVVWFACLRAQEPRVGWTPAYLVYAVTSLSRYLPVGKGWQFLAVVQYGDGESTRSQRAYALILTTILGILSGAILAGVGYSPRAFSVPVWAGAPAAALIALGVLLVLARGIPIPGLTTLVERRCGGALGLAPLPFGTGLVCLVVFLVFSWLAEGGAALLLLHAIDSARGAELLFFFLPCYAIASLSGYLAFFVPGGIGVREGALVYLLSERLPVEEAAFVALGLRVFITFADVLLSAPAGLLMIHRAVRERRTRPAAH